MKMQKQLQRTSLIKKTKFKSRNGIPKLRKIIPPVFARLLRGAVGRAPPGERSGGARRAARSLATDYPARTNS